MDLLQMAGFAALCILIAVAYFGIEGWLGSRGPKDETVTRIAEERQALADEERRKSADTKAAK